MSENIQTTTPAPAPSKHAVPTNRIFMLPMEIAAKLIPLHASLHAGLQSILRLRNQTQLPGDLGELLRFGVPTVSHVKSDGPILLTTEIIFNRTYDPFVVKLDAHSGQALELLAQLPKSALETEPQYAPIVEIMRNKIGLRRVPLTMIRRPNGSVRYPHLAATLEQHGISVAHQTLREAVEMQDSLPFLLDHPIFQGSAKRQRALLEHSHRIIDPHVMLSSQHALAILANTEERQAVEHALLQHGEIDKATLDQLRQYIPRMYSIRPGVCFREFPISILKYARPFERSPTVEQSPRMVSTQSYVTSPEILETTVSGQPYRYVAQEHIPPAMRRLPDTEGTIAPRRFRLIAISYGGEILACFCIVEIVDAVEQSPRHIGISVYVT